MNHPFRAQVKSQPIDFRMPKKLKAWLNKLRDDVVSIAPQSGRNIKLRQFRTGTEFSAEAGGGEVELEYPFKVTDASTGGVAQLGVRFGEVTEFINDPVAPTGMTEEDNDPLYALVAGSGDTSIHLKVTVDTDLESDDYGEITAVALETNTAVPSNNYASGFFYLQLASFASDGVAITDLAQLAGGSMGFQLSGESGLFWSLGPAY